MLSYSSWEIRSAASAAFNKSVRTRHVSQPTGSSMPNLSVVVEQYFRAKDEMVHRP
jgi:hypothetical protein